MKTQQKNNSIPRKKIIKFVTRLQAGTSLSFTNDFARGWKAACAFYAHELYTLVRENDKH